MSTSTPEQTEGSAGIRGENRHNGPQHARNELLSQFLYLVTFHQLFHLLMWATNANMIFPWLSYIFPGNIDGTDLWTKHVYKYDYYPMVISPIIMVCLHQLTTII